jgi:hypothetical protein
MAIRNAVLQSGILVAASLSSVLLITGCGGGDFGSELTVRPKPHLLSGSDGQVLRLPHDEPFSITLAPTQETPGLGGTAEADTQVSKKGNADAVARVENGGSALAQFQLGHALKNDSDRQMDLHVHLACDCQTEAEATPPGPLPDAKISLTLFARDNHNRLLRSINLAQHSTEEGAAASKDHAQRSFTLTLGPGESVNVFVAGSARVDTQDGHSARGSIKLSGLEMEIKTELAPPVQQAADEQD